MPKLWKNLLVAGVATALGATTLSTPAFAASDITYWAGGHGTVNSAHQIATACDDKANNRGIRVDFVWGLDGDHNSSIGDANGKGGGCGSTGFLDGIRAYRVCEAPTGQYTGGDCSPWKEIGFS
jgi:hypothetical protein